MHKSHFGHPGCTPEAPIRNAIGFANFRVPACSDTICPPDRRALTANGPSGILDTIHIARKPCGAGSHPPK